MISSRLVSYLFSKKITSLQAITHLMPSIRKPKLLCKWVNLLILNLPYKTLDCSPTLMISLRLVSYLSRNQITSLPAVTHLMPSIRKPKLLCKRVILLMLNTLLQNIGLLSYRDDLITISILSIQQDDYITASYNTFNAVHTKA